MTTPADLIAVLAQDLREQDAADRNCRAARAQKLKRVADNTNGSPAAEAAANALKGGQQVFEQDVIVILQALAEAVAKHNMHSAERRSMVDELHTLIEWQLDLLGDEEDDDGADAWYDMRRDLEDAGAAA